MALVGELFQVQLHIYRYRLRLQNVVNHLPFKKGNIVEWDEKYTGAIFNFDA